MLSAGVGPAAAVAEVVAAGPEAAEVGGAAPGKSLVAATEPLAAGLPHADLTGPAGFGGVEATVPGFFAGGAAVTAGLTGDTVGVVRALEAAVFGLVGLETGV